MRFCNSICTHFLNQIKKNSGPQGGTWQYTSKIDMDPRVYNFRVVYEMSGNNTKYINIEDYRRCGECGILYNKSWGFNRCICCNNLLNFSYYSRHRVADRKRVLKRY